jgi:hypothetical protein
MLQGRILEGTKSGIGAGRGEEAGGFHRRGGAFMASEREGIDQGRRYNQADRSRQETR